MTQFNDDHQNGWLDVPEDPDLSYDMHYQFKVLGWDRDKGEIDFVLRFAADGGHTLGKRPTSGSAQTRSSTNASIARSRLNRLWRFGDVNVSETLGALGTLAFRVSQCPRKAMMVPKRDDCPPLRVC